MTVRGESYGRAVVETFYYQHVFSENVARPKLHYTDTGTTVQHLQLVSLSVGSVVQHVRSRCPCVVEFNTNCPTAKTALVWKLLTVYANAFGDRENEIQFTICLFASDNYNDSPQSGVVYRRAIISDCPIPTLPSPSDSVYAGFGAI